MRMSIRRRKTKGRALPGPKVAMLGVAMAAFATMPATLAAETGPAGTWLTESGNAKVHIAPCTDIQGARAVARDPDGVGAGVEYCGEIVWLAEPLNAEGEPVTDANNPEPALRDRPVLGLVILYGFVAPEEGEPWEGGRIYNPEDGETYRAVMTVRDGGRRLGVRGYVGLPLLGQTQVWTRDAP